MKELKVDVILTDEEVEYLKSVDWEKEDEWVYSGLMFRFWHLESMGLLIPTKLDKHGKPKMGNKYRVCLSTLGKRVLEKLNNSEDSSHS